MGVWNEGREAEQRTQRVGKWLCVVGELALASTCTQAPTSSRNASRQASNTSSSTWAAKRDAQNEGKRGRQGRREISK